MDLQKLDKMEICTDEVKGRSCPMQVFTAGAGIPVIILHGA